MKRLWFNRRNYSTQESASTHIASELNDFAAQYRSLKKPQAKTNCSLCLSVTSSNLIGKTSIIAI